MRIGDGIERILDGQLIYSDDPMTATGLCKAASAMSEEDMAAFWANVEEANRHEAWIMGGPDPVERRPPVAARMRPPDDRRVDLTLEEALARLERVRRTGPYRWVARCPVHEDRSPSLEVWEKADKPGEPGFRCYAGCDWLEIRRALGAS